MSSTKYGMQNLKERHQTKSFTVLMSICSASLGRNGLPAGLIGHSVSPRPPFQAIRGLSHTWVFWSGLPWCQLVHPYIKCYSKLFEKTKTVLSSSFRKEDASLTEDRMASRQCSKDKSIGVLTQSKAPHWSIN